MPFTCLKQHCAMHIYPGVPAGHVLVFSPLLCFFSRPSLIGRSDSLLELRALLLQFAELTDRQTIQICQRAHGLPGALERPRDFLSGSLVAGRIPTGSLFFARRTQQSSTRGELPVGFRFSFFASLFCLLSSLISFGGRQKGTAARQDRHGAHEHVGALVGDHGHQRHRRPAPRKLLAFVAGTSILCCALLGC